MSASSFARLGRVSLVYFLLASVAVTLTRFDGGVAFLWAATGYLIAELTVVRRRRWLATLAVAACASMVATGVFGLGWSSAAPMAAANILEAWLAAFYIRRHAPESALTTLGWFGRFTLFAALLPTVLSGAIAALVAISVGREPIVTFVHFYSGHALSTLTFAPVFILLLSGEVRSFVKQASGRLVEALALIGLSLGATILCFTQISYPLLFLPVLPIILATFRLGRGGTVVCILLLTLIGGACTLAGLGPAQLISGNPGLRIQFFQFYLAMTVITAWPVAADLSNRSRLHRNLRQSEERYRMIAEHSSDILLQTSAEGIVRYVSPAVKVLAGYDPAALIGTNAAALIDSQYRNQARQLHAATLREPQQTHSLEYEGVSADGRLRWFETHSRAILDDNGAIDGVISIIRDITTRKAAEAALSAAALTDPLTGLLNRRALAAELDARFKLGSVTSSQHCIALLDIDHFKKVNDLHGHDAGDAVLRNFAALAKRSIRKNDLVARVGGEEFVIFFEDTSIAQARAICESLRTKLADSVTQVHGKEIIVTVSGGVARLQSSDVDAAMRLADVALYEAKRGGRDRLALAA